MANEFIIKNGFHSKGDSQVTGSLGVSGSLQIQGIANVSASIAAAGGSTPTLQQVTTAGSSTSDQITTSNGINFSSDYITKLVSSTFKLNQGAEDISTEIIGFGGNTNAKFNDTDLQLTGSTGGVKIKGPITGDDQFTLPKLNVSASVLNFSNLNYKINATNTAGIIFNSDDRTVSTLINGSDGLGCGLEVGNKTTIISGSLHVKQFGITSSAGLLLNDSSTNSVASTTNRILTPIFQSSGPGYPLLIQPGDSIAGSGGTGAHVYLQGGDATNASSAGSGGNVYIIGGTSSTTSSSTGSIFLKGNTVNLDNTSLSHYGNSTNNRVIISNDTDHVNIGVVSYNATGGGPFGIKFFADGVEAFKIEGASGQKAIFQGSRSGQHTEVRATSGSFSYLRGQSPLIIDADNFSVTSTGEMSSGTGDGISTTSITASGDISSSGTITGNSFVKGGGTSAQFLKADGSVDSSTYSTATGVENNADVTDATNVAAAGALMASNNLSDIGNAETARDNLGLGTAATAATGISNTNVPVFTSGVVDDDFLRVNGTSIEGLSAAEVKTALGISSGIFSQVGSTTQFSTTSSLLVSGSNNSAASASLEVHGSGSNIFKVEGSIGTLFSVDDGLDDVIFAANNVSGTPVISANADNTVKLGKLGGFGIVISGSTPAPNDSQAKIIITGSIHTSGSLGVGMAASSTIGRIDAKNDVVAFSTSDERLKDNITPIENALNKVSQVQGIEFDWVEKEGVHGNEGHDVGVIAQEIEKVLPEVVTTRDNGYKAVKYEKIIPLLVEAIKELQAEVQELKKYK